MSAVSYLAHQVVSEEQIQEWVEAFHRDGYLFLQNVLPPDWVAELKADLERVLRDLEPGAGTPPPAAPSARLKGDPCASDGGWRPCQ